MLSTLYSCRVPILCSTRSLSLNLVRPNRFGKSHLRDRIAKTKQNFKSSPKQSGETVNYVGPDSIPVRPVSHLWRAAGFTAAFSAGIFTYSCIAHYQRRRGESNWASWFSSEWTWIHQYSKKVTFDGQTLRVEEKGPQFSPGQKVIYTLIAANIGIYLVWKLAPKAFMWRYFTNGYASKSLCVPMVTSIFSHQFFLHMAINMYVLSNFGAPVIDFHLGPEQFLAFYLSAGVFSSFTSLIDKAVRRMPIRALGASGAILGVLTYACMKNPDARLQIIFLPFFDFSAQQGVVGILLLDAAGLIFRWRLFDHAAHLGGAIFGILYAWYGEKYYRQVLYPKIVRAMKNW